MIDTQKHYPWWRTTLEAVDEALDSVRIGQVQTLCTSAGGRTIRYVTYGEKPDFHRTANYNSACGARDTRYYADREGKPPVILLIGAVHGQELEGTAALLNLIHALETGADLRGIQKPFAERVFRSRMRLILIPVMNPDGRARCEPDAMLGMTNADLRYWGQGTWKDGTLCGWPGCKAVHPIKDAAGHLGAYFNDDGINLMHDDFFHPMADETTALLTLAAEEAPDYIIQLHGGSNCTNELLQPSYVPMFIKQRLLLLAERIAALLKVRGLPASVHQPSAEDFPPPSFNLTSALHHVCGGVSATYESNQGLAEKNAFSAEEILTHHEVLFEALFDIAGAAGAEGSRS